MTPVAAYSKLYSNVSVSVYLANVLPLQWLQLPPRTTKKQIVKWGKISWSTLQQFHSSTQEANAMCVPLCANMFPFCCYYIFIWLGNTFCVSFEKHFWIYGSVLNNTHKQNIVYFGRFAHDISDLQYFVKKD